MPRSDGRIIVGSTLEDVGFDKTVNAEVIQRLHQAAANHMPPLGEARIHEVWAGLRPGTPDGLPLMGSTRISGYYVCAGHYRDGIMLAPSSARLMAQLITTGRCDVTLDRFSPSRFGG